MIFGDFNFDILLTVLDVFNFLWSIFWGELPHTKGVYILDFFLVQLLRLGVHTVVWR